MVQEFQEEKERLARRELEERSLQQAAQQLHFRQMALASNSPVPSVVPNGFDGNIRFEAQADQKMAINNALHDAESIQLFSQESQPMAPPGSRGYLTGSGISAGGGLNGSGIQNEINYFQPLNSQFYGQTGADRNFASGLGGGQVSRDALIRRELTGDGYWLPNIVTNKAGKAKLSFTLPSATSEWRLTSKGITVNTLAGQSTVKVVTRKPFFVSMKAPSQLQEGDTIQVLSRVHNLIDFEGNAELELQVFGGEKFDKVLMERTAKLKVYPGGVSEALFESITIPSAANLRVQITAKTTDHTDILQKTFPVRPWGLEFAVQQQVMQKHLYPYPKTALKALNG